MRLEYFNSILNILIVSLLFSVIITVIFSFPVLNLIGHNHTHRR